MLSWAFFRNCTRNSFKASFSVFLLSLENSTKVFFGKSHNDTFYNCPCGFVRNILYEKFFLIFFQSLFYKFTQKLHKLLLEKLLNESPKKLLNNFWRYLSKSFFFLLKISWWDSWTTICEAFYEVTSGEISGRTHVGISE